MKAFYFITFAVILLLFIGNCSNKVPIDKEITQPVSGKQLAGNNDIKPQKQNIINDLKIPVEESIQTYDNYEEAAKDIIKKITHNVKQTISEHMHLFFIVGRTKGTSYEATSAFLSYIPYYGLQLISTEHLLELLFKGDNFLIQSVYNDKKNEPKVFEANVVLAVHTEVIAPKKDKIICMLIARKNIEGKDGIIKPRIVLPYCSFSAYVKNNGRKVKYNLPPETPQFIADYSGNNNDHESKEEELINFNFHVYDDIENKQEIIVYKVSRNELHYKTNDPDNYNIFKTFKDDEGIPQFIINTPKDKFAYMVYRNDSKVANCDKPDENYCKEWELIVYNKSDRQILKKETLGNLVEIARPEINHLQYNESISNNTDFILPLYSYKSANEVKNSILLSVDKETKIYKWPYQEIIAAKIISPSENYGKVICIVDKNQLFLYKLSELKKNNYNFDSYFEKHSINSGNFTQIEMISHGIYSMFIDSTLFYLKFENNENVSLENYQIEEIKDGIKTPTSVSNNKKAKFIFYGAKTLNNNVDFHLHSISYDDDYNIEQKMEGKYSINLPDQHPDHRTVRLFIKTASLSSDFTLFIIFRTRFEDGNSYSLIKYRYEYDSDYYKYERYVEGNVDLGEIELTNITFHDDYIIIPQRINSKKFDVKIIKID